MKRLLEIACFNLQSVLAAQSAGADRIELCEDYASGGVSPSIPDIEYARKQVAIPLHVIIRPRPADFGFPFTLSPAGDFNYPEMEVQLMIQYIAASGFIGVDGIVFGALTKKKEIDLKTCERLISAAENMSLTFHRAIDQCPDMERAMEQLIELGVQRVLTSGGPGNAIENIERLKKLQKKFGSKIIIMPGGGVRSSNISALLTTGCTEFHSAALMPGLEVASTEEIKTLRLALNT